MAETLPNETFEYIQENDQNSFAKFELGKKHLMVKDWWFDCKISSPVFLTQ